MSKRILHILGTAYRATLEEQDDPIVWLCHALRAAGAELDVLLEGPAVLYGVRQQGVDPLAFGTRRQRHAPDLPGDLTGLERQGVTCFYLEEDAVSRGIDPNDLVEALVPVSAEKRPELFASYAQVHRW